MKKLIFIIAVFVSFLIPSISSGQSSNIMLIDPALTIAGRDTLFVNGIDTLSKFVNKSNLSSHFGSDYQLTIYTGADTLLVFVGTTAAFTTGQTAYVLPGIPLNRSYFKIPSGSNVFIKNIGGAKATYYYIADGL